MPGKLTAMQVKNAKPGKHSDGGGLTLLVKPSGARSWVVRVAADGKRRDVGIGGWPKVSLADARRRAEAMRADAARAAGKQAPATFAEVARDLLDVLAPQWRSPQQARDWWARLENHAGPIMGKPVAAVTRRDVLAILEPMLSAKPVAAKVLRQQVRKVLARAMAFDESITANAAGEALDAVLHAVPRQHQHHRAIDFADVPEAVRIIERSGTELATRLALRFLILTAVRSTEARAATWGEIDLDAAVWTIPGERMKKGRTHRVPLSAEAIAVLDAARELGGCRDGDLIFPSSRTGRPLSSAALRFVLNDNAIDGTPHGMRSAFRQWAMEQPGYSWAACELALAHRLGNGVVVAYTRDHDLLEERRALMAAWATFATS